MKLPDVTLDTERLAGLLFELYSQLHAERLHRLVLEAALVDAGVLDNAALTRIAADDVVRDRGREAASDSVAQLMRVLTEGADERTPLRAASTPSSAPGTQGD